VTRRPTSTRATRCPECGGRVVVEDAERLQRVVIGGFAVRGEPLPTRRVACVVRACTACEYVALVPAT